MAGNVDNLYIPQGAEIWRATVGTTAPTNPTTAWGAGWASFGMIVEDGVTLTYNSDTNDIYVLSATGSVWARRVETHQTWEIGFALTEDTDVVFKALNPGSLSATVSTVTTRQYKTRTTAFMALGIDLLDGTNHKRLVVPKVQVNRTGDVTFGAGQLTAPAATAVIQPQSDLFFIEYTDQAGALAP